MKKTTKKKPDKPVELFVALRHEMMKTPAWRAMTCSARIYYLHLKSLVNVSKPEENNGNIFICQRDAAEAMGVARGVIERAHQEVIHFGFVVETSPGRFGTDGRGRAPHLELTELPTKRGEATKNYLKWDGTPFESQEMRRRRRKAETHGPDSGQPRPRNKAIRMAQKQGHAGPESGPYARPRN
jgi:hypothetical protein